MFTVAALYHFTRFDDPMRLQAPLARSVRAG
jgi:predicted sulfurtransferase